MTPTSTDQALARLLEAGRARAQATDADHARLWDELARATEGGKRFRPALLVSAHDALRGQAPDAAAQVGAAVELLHTAFVIHDDVIDDDHERRGRPNVSGSFGRSALAAGVPHALAGDYGRTAAILAGDLALAASVRTVATCGAAPQVVDRLLDLFDAALHTTAAGELADVRLSVDLRPASLAESLLMLEQKTSAYSFSLPLQAGAVLAGADDATTACLGEAGRVLGLAFQLVDDLIGVFGDPRLSGKSTTNDLRTGKQTPLLVHARSTPEWDRIAPHVGTDLDAEALTDVRRALTRSGSRAFVEDLARQHLGAARTVLDGLGVAPDLLDAMSTPPPLVQVDAEVAA